MMSEPRAQEVEGGGCAVLLLLGFWFFLFFRFYCCAVLFRVVRSFSLGEGF